MKYYLIGLLFLMLFNLRVRAAETGCLIPNNVIYKQGTVLNILGAQVYERTGATATLPANYCSWTPTSGTTCYVCNTLLALGICLDTATQGYYSANFNIVQCNLDDYTWTLGAAAGLFGVFVIRRRSKL
jgi:hypothetical protein